MRFILIIVSILGLSFLSMGQGCSDAGLCTVSGLDSGLDKDDMPVTARYSTIFGLGEQSVFHVTTQFEVVIPTFKHQIVQIKMPYNFTFGNLGNISGLGDLSISLNQNVFSGKDSRLNIIAGAKIPSNDGNKSKDGFPLPMAYQPSLGTYDLIIGISYLYKKWHFGFGYQHPFGHNLNEFQHSYNNPANFNNYNESYHLQRADDIMLRLERQFNVNNLTLLFGALPIYHLGNDKIKGGQIVQNSSGLTLNLNAKAEKKLKNNWIIDLALAAPIIAREARPDGLTRSFVAVISIAKRL